MKAKVKKTGELVNVEPLLINIDELTSYYVYIDESTKIQYKYSELNFFKNEN